jgi:hypothetical protein
MSDLNKIVGDETDFKQCPTCDMWVDESQIKSKLDVNSRFQVTCSLLGALAKYQQLLNLQNASMVHLMKAEDLMEFNRLSQWWNNFEDHKKERLIEMAEDLSKTVHITSRMF